MRGDAASAHGGALQGAEDRRVSVNHSSGAPHGLLLQVREHPPANFGVSSQRYPLHSNGRLGAD